MTACEHNFDSVWMTTGSNIITLQCIKCGLTEINQAATKRLAERRAFNGWERIESAPKDGTPILMIIRGMRQIGAWLPHRDISYPMAWKDPISGDVLVREWKDDPFPTYWQHLPEPPQ